MNFILCAATLIGIQLDTNQPGQVPTDIYEPWHVISNNVAFWHVKTRANMYSLLLNLETPNDVWSVAIQPKNIQARSKGSDQTARMRRLIGGFAGRTYHVVGNLMSRLNYWELVNITDSLEFASLSTRDARLIMTILSQQIDYQPMLIWLKNHVGSGNNLTVWQCTNK